MIKKLTSTFEVGFFVCNVYFFSFYLTQAESHDSKIFSKKLLLNLPLWYNESSFLYVKNA